LEVRPPTLDLIDTQKAVTNLSELRWDKFVTTCFVSIPIRVGSPDLQLETELWRASLSSPLLVHSLVVNVSA
jgi:hypothetical protein